MGRIASRPKSKAPEESQWTGLWWPCPINAVAHLHPLGLRIMRGPKFFFIHCGICKLRVFLPKHLWREDVGMTEAQATAQGLYLV